MNDFAGQEDNSRERHREDAKVTPQGRGRVTNESGSSDGDWRATAKRIAAEKDPVKLMDLADQLIGELDRVRKPESTLSAGLAKPGQQDDQLCKDGEDMEPSDQQPSDHDKVVRGERQFIYRHNADDSIDSICVRCLRTVAKAKHQWKLELEEREHVCQRL